MRSFPDSFTGTVDGASANIVTVVVDVNYLPRVQEGDKVAVVVFGHEGPPDHACDWRFYARRPDGLCEVICVDPIHDPNTKMRVCAKIASVTDLPKYDGTLDVY